MEQYILKSDLVAEIERRITNIKGYCLREGHDTRFDVVPEQLSLILAFINTLDVKEVDFDIEVALWANAILEMRLDDVERLAKYFYELGLNAKGE